MFGGRVIPEKVDDSAGYVPAGSGVTSICEGERSIRRPPAFHANRMMTAPHAACDRRGVMSAHPKPRLRTAVLVALAIGSVAVAGCGSSKSSSSSSSASTATSTTKGPTFNTSTIESGIKAQFSSGDATVTSVKCPSGVKAENGATLKCTVAWSNDATGQVKVTQNAPNHYSYELVSGSVQIPGAALDKTIAQQLAKQGVPNAQVNCPQNVIVKTGTTVTCAVSSANGKANGSVTFQFSSAEGTVEPSSVKTSG